MIETRPSTAVRSINGIRETLASSPPFLESKMGHGAANQLSWLLLAFPSTLSSTSVLRDSLGRRLKRIFDGSSLVNLNNKPT